MGFALDVKVFNGYHTADEGLVHGKPTNAVGITGKPKHNFYNIMLPDPEEVKLFSSMDVKSITAGCMDIRESFQLYEAVDGDGMRNIVTLYAGGGATGKENKRRFAADVNFLVGAWKETSANPLIQLFAHDEGCAWAKKMVEPETVYLWQQKGDEQTRMMERVGLMREAIIKEFKWSFFKPTIAIGLVHLVNDQFHHIDWNY